MTISSRQVSLLQVARRQLGLDEDTWRALLLRLGGVHSTKELTTEGFEAVLAACERFGFTPTGAVGQFYGDRAGMATPRQVQFIRDMWRRYRGGVFDEAAMNGWLRAKFKVSSLRFADSATAGRIINALREMTARRNDAA